MARRRSVAAAHWDAGGEGGEGQWGVRRALASGAVYARTLIREDVDAVLIGDADELRLRLDAHQCASRVVRLVEHQVASVLTDRGPHLCWVHLPVVGGPQGDCRHLSARVHRGLLR